MNSTAPLKKSFAADASLIAIMSRTFRTAMRSQAGISIINSSYRDTPQRAAWSIIYCILLVIAAAAVPSDVRSADISASARTEPEQQKVFPLRERRWAVNWVNSRLPVIMGSGAIKTIIDNKEVYEIYVGQPWYQLPFSTRGALLQELSRVREITGHSPFFSALDSASHDVTAVISEYGIKILVAGEGFFTYICEPPPSPDTVY